jgi:hypothetical protein
VRHQNLAEKTFVAAPLRPTGFAKLQLSDLLGLQKEDASVCGLSRIVAWTTAPGLEVHISLAAARDGMDTQASALSREVEQLEYVVDADVLERSFESPSDFLQVSQLAVLPRRGVVRIELQDARRKRAPHRECA